MTNFFKILLLSSSVAFLTACGGGDGDSDSSSGIPLNNIENPVVRTATYPNPVLEAVSAIHQKIEYKMLGVDGEEVNATTLVFTPKVTAPAGGFPIVVWAHGTTGVADQCAPSAQGLGNNELLIAGLVQAGYVVVAPDYEGLGTFDGPADDHHHPFLNLKSAAFSITDAVVAARKFLIEDEGLSVSNKWVTIGHSQGGHAALGAAQYAERAQLDYKGTVAIAPASNLLNILTTGENVAQLQPTSEQITTYSMLDAFTALIVSGMQGHNETIAYNQVFTDNLLGLAQQGLDECYVPLATNFGNSMGIYAAGHSNSLTGYARLQTNFQNHPVISNFLENTAQPLKVNVKTPIYIYQGSADTVVPFTSTNMLVTDARYIGNTITYTTDVNETTKWDHSSVVSANIPSFFANIATLFQN